MALVVVVEDGTGLATANAYDDETAFAGWLADREYEDFVNDTNQALVVIEATQIMERKIEHYLTGEPLSELQALHFPRTNARDSRGLLLDSDERPAAYREAIFLLAEHIAAARKRGRRLQLVDDMANVRAHGSGSSRMEYRSARSFADLYPDVWDQVAPVIAPGAGQFLVRA